MDILRIAPENVTPLWPQLEPLVIRALRNTATHTAEDVRGALLAMQSHLFAGMDGNRVQSLLVTTFASYPRGVWLHVWLTASLPDVPLDIAAFFAVAEQWRIRNGCRGMQITGARHGWIKKFPQAEFDGVTMRLTDVETTHGHRSKSSE